MAIYKSPTDVAGRASRYLSTFGRDPVAAAIVQSTIGSNMAVAANNSALFAPIQPQYGMVVTGLVWIVGSQSGNYDIGIYDEGGSKIWSKGSTAVAATGTVVTETPVGVTFRGGGTYYIGWSSDNTTSGVRGIGGTSVGALATLADGTLSTYSVATQFPLASTVTLGSTAPNRLPFFVIRGT